MKFKTSDDVRIVYDDIGNGKPVVLLAGIGTSRLIWNFQIKELVANGYRVINVDARNQGESQRTAKGQRIARHAEDLRELLEYLELTVALVLIGNSMGAATIFSYVSLFSDSEIKAVIDLDQSPKMIADNDWSYGFKDLNWHNFPGNLKLAFGKATYQRLPAVLHEIIAKESARHPYIPADNYRFLVDHVFQDWRDVIQFLRIPLLVVAGQNSPFFNPEFAKETAKLAHQGESVIIPNCGHIVMAEQPAILNQTILQFMQTI